MQENSRILIVNNYERYDRRTARLQEVVKEITAFKPDMIDFQQIDPSEIDEFDCIILSGSDNSLTDAHTTERYRKLIEGVSRSDRSMLGICFGHQMIAASFGSRIASLRRFFKGFSEIDLLVDDILFSGLNKKIRVFESHSNFVVKLMPELVHLAKAEHYEIEAFRHLEKPIYGVQFHPERYDDENPDGRTVLKNFFELIVK